MRVNDTIAAPATPPGPAVRAIVRTSGPRAFALLATLAAGDRPPHASATERTLALADGIGLPATVYAFVGPRSATGEDVVEYHLPGSPLFVRMLLARLFAAGARMAEPGEFTARAFFAGRLDLARAEGVAATIAAANRRELDAARQLLAGELNRRLSPIVDALVRLLASVEADLDFADEPVDSVGDAAIRDGIDAIDGQLTALLRDAPRIERLAHEPRIVLTGRPNAGKSTLLNALAGHDRAVVSHVAGTTRDALSARIALRRGFVTLVDTAGVESADEGDAIARQMQDAAADERARADAVVQVIAADDADAERADVDAVIWTKADVAATPAGRLALSARTGVGVDALRSRLDEIAFGTAADAPAGTVALNARHVAAVERARDALRAARASVGHGGEFVAGELRHALDRLGDVGGAVTPDDVLGKIFGSFCIGK